MSMYSGKCDLYDSLIMIHNYEEEELLKNVLIFVGNNKEPLKLKSSKELIPYYPYIICCAHFDNELRKSVIYVTSESFVDIEEKESLNFKLKQVLKVYNRCKRKKIDFDIDSCIKEVCYQDYCKDIYIELVTRVKEKGKKATIDGLHLDMYERYRVMLVDEMIRNGLDPKLYGYERFCDKSL